MTNSNTNYEWKQVSTKEIIVNDLAQRDVSKRTAQFKKIMTTFDKNLVNPVKVAFIDGRYYCIDGQMTMKVLKARNGNRDLLVDCKVLYGLTHAQAAELFWKQNGITSQVGVMDKLRVQFNYGEKEVVNFVKLTEANGVIIDWESRHDGRNKIVAVSTLYKIYGGFSNAREYSNFLQILLSAWDGDSVSLQKGILEGLFIFMTTYRDEFKTDLLIKKLKKVSPTQIIREAKLSAEGGSRKYAIQFLNIYNKGLNANRLSERW